MMISAAWRALGLALTLAVSACGGPRAREAERPEDGDAPFVQRSDFTPTAFVAEVRGQGRPVIFIPGLACPGAIWDETIERLGPGIEAHVLTLAGFAGTPPVKPPLAAKVRRELVRYIRSRRLSRPIVIGHSLGGFVAYWLAASSPDLLGGVIVIDAGPALVDADARDARRLRNMWAQAGDEELPEQIRTVYAWMTRRPDTLARYLASIASSDRQSIGDAIYELVTTDVRDRMRDIAAPTLVVLADGSYQDRYRAMVRDIPEHEVVVLRGTRHFVMFDDPAGLVRAISRFLGVTAP